MMDEPVHEYFGLSYDTFVVVHRSIAQTMPVEWQRKFVALMEEADDAVRKHDVKTADWYSLSARTADGRFTQDPIPHYQRGRTRLWKDKR